MPAINSTWRPTATLVPPQTLVDLFGSLSKKWVEYTTYVGYHCYKSMVKVIFPTRDYFMYKGKPNIFFYHVTRLNFIGNSIIFCLYNLLL